MKSLVINIKDDTIVDKVLWMLEHFKNDGLEIVSKEDMEDLKLLKETRSEEKIDFRTQKLLNLQNIKKLTNFEPAYRLRIGDYRVLFDVEDDNLIVGRVLHRKESYL